MLAPIFIALNVMDAYLTKMALVAGAVEANPLITSIGSSMIAKGLIAIAVVFILYWFGKERVLWPVNFLFSGIILWNSAIYWILTFPAASLYYD